MDEAIDDSFHAFLDQLHGYPSANDTKTEEIPIVETGSVSSPNAAELS